jgi:hypothetical protein
VGEYFYNVVDNRLWIGALGSPQEISLAQLFELTYAEAQLQKTIVGSPSGDGLIIGALYKITDKGSNGLILQAIDIDKFSNYCDELIASPEEHIPAIYDFDNDVLTYPSVPTYKEYEGLLTQTSTNAPTEINNLNQLSGLITWSRDSNGIYIGTLTGAFPANKTHCYAQVSNNLVVISFTRLSDNEVYVTTYDGGYNDGILNKFSFKIRVYN